MCSDSVYVVFEKSDTKHLFKPFINKHINHCYLIIPDGDKLIIANKSIDKYSIYTIDNLDDILRDKIVVKATPKKNKRSLLMIDSCVGGIKQYLGIRNPFIWTPYQLMRALT